MPEGVLGAITTALVSNSKSDLKYQIDVTQKH